MKDTGRLLYKYLRVSKNTNFGGSHIGWTIDFSDGPSVQQNLHLKVDVSGTVTPYNYTNDRNRVEKRLEGV